MDEVSAVECRIELDLRVGAAFTRFQTLAVEKKLGRSAEKRGPISYGITIYCYKRSTVAYNVHILINDSFLGTCQTPTLNFVVERYLEISSFVPEPYYKLNLTADCAKKIEFTWDRQHLFDKQMTTTLYEKCMESPEIRVASVKTKNTHKLCVQLHMTLPFI